MFYCLNLCIFIKFLPIKELKKSKHGFTFMGFGPWIYKMVLFDIKKNKGGNYWFTLTCWIGSASDRTKLWNKLKPSKIASVKNQRAENGERAKEDKM